jgi:hypothetical protein
MNERRVNHAAHLLTVSVMGIIENLLREEEKRDAYEAIYQVAKAGIERFDLDQERERKRLFPLTYSEN